MKGIDLRPTPWIILYILILSAFCSSRFCQTFTNRSEKEVEAQGSKYPSTGTKVVMTGADIELTPAYKNKIWTVTMFPQFMCGEVVVWLDGFSGAYSAEMLRFPRPDEDLPF